MDRDLEMLKQECEQMIDNIYRVNNFIEKHKDDKWKPISSRVVGELKHRAVVLKQRLTQVSKFTTSGFFY